MTTPSAGQVLVERGPEAFLWDVFEMWQRYCCVSNTDCSSKLGGCVSPACCGLDYKDVWHGWVACPVH